MSEYFGMDSFNRDKECCYTISAQSPQLSADGPEFTTQKFVTLDNLKQYTAISQQVDVDAKRVVFKDGRNLEDLINNIFISADKMLKNEAVAASCWGFKRRDLKTL